VAGPALTKINERSAKPRMLQPNGAILVSWRRGLLRLWLIGGAAWLIGWVLFIRGRCHGLPDGGLLCQNDRDGVLSFLGDFAAWTPVQLYSLGLAVPVAVLVVGSVIVPLTWLWRRKELP
jgi:hypothetical protein